MVGQTIGKYRVVSRLGRGGMGTVYKAVDETLDREVAIKCLNHDLGDPDVMKRFRAEALTLARLNHPCIATLFELTEYDGQMLMVMEFVRGETLEGLSQRLGPLPVDQAAQLCSQVLDALTHAHRAGVVHRDLKPANLMLTESGLTKVMDFGLARIVGTEHLTNHGFMVGTPAYMAPEQVLAHEIDGRADLYAMGVVLFRLLTTKLPFNADSGIAMAQKQLHDQPTPARQFRTELPQECDDIFGRALAKAPEERFQTAEDFRAALVVLGAPLSGLMTAPSGTQSLSGLSSVNDPVPRATRGPSMPVSLVNESSETVKLPSAVTARGNLAATIATGAVLVVGLSAAVLLWRARSVPSTPAVAGTTTGPAAPGSSAAAPVRAKKSAAAPEPPPGGVPGAESVAKPVLPIVIFAKMKLLVVEGGKSSDRDASLRLGADGLEILDGEKIIQQAAYRDITGVFQSHSREPRWVKADGTTVPVARVGGKFGFLKGAPDWITVETPNGFIPLRIDERDLARVVAELEARAGAKVVRTR